MQDRSCQQADKRRHSRRKVLIPARMKQGAGWSDVCIRDISSRGMLVQAGMPPGRGSYVEIRRGAHVIIAKVAWAQDRQFGVTTQDLLPIDAIIQNPQAGAFGRNQSPGSDAPVERRAQPRPPSAAQSHERSRQTSSLLQYGFMLVLALAFAVTFMGFVRDAFSGSLATVESALEGTSPPPSSGVQ